MIHRSLCLAMLVSFVLLHFTTCVTFDAYTNIHPEETKGTLVHAFLTSRIDYCNSLLYGLPSNQLAKIQRVLNASARLVCNAPRFCHVTSIMHDLHWLLIRACINFKVLLTFKALHGLLPQYLLSSISVKTSCYNLRGFNTLLLAIPSLKSKAMLGDRKFTIAAPSSKDLSF